MEKYKIALKKHVKTTVDTLALMGMMGTAVALGLVLAGQRDWLENQTLVATLWYLIAGMVLYVAYNIYTLKINQKQ